MKNEEIKELILDTLQRNHDLCNRHSEDISATKEQVKGMKDDISDVKTGVEKLVALSEKWIDRTINNEKDISSLKLGNKFVFWMGGTLLTITGITVGLFRDQIINVIKAIFIIVLCLGLVSCANYHEWQKQTVIDRIKQIETSTLIYKSDTGFDLGTEGLGEYYLIKVEGF